MASLAVVATCNLNQWAMDFEGNLNRTILSIKQARKQGARYRIGPELEITGYGCEDHFLEADTFTHSWECIAKLIRDGHSDDMLLDIGAPVIHRDVSYNCRVLILNREILLIRPKANLADSGNYREPRWFRAWPLDRDLETFRLPECVREVLKANVDGTCPIGHAFVEVDHGVTIACETCEELWTPQSPHIEMLLCGAHIIGNGSASHHVLRKRSERLDLIQGATRKNGGVYLYANQRGCDGGRLYYDGCALIALNGDIVQLAPQFSVASEVDVVTAVIDMHDISAHRLKHASRGVQASSVQAHNKWSRIKPSVKPFSVTVLARLGPNGLVTAPTKARDNDRERALRFEEEIANGPACWMWDYLRRSGLNGYFVPLSGGADSASTAALVAQMCHMVVRAVNKYRNDIAACDIDEFDLQQYHLLIDDVRRVTGTDQKYVPTDGKDLVNRIFHTAYMPCGDSSSRQTRDRATLIAKDINSFHSIIDITIVLDSIVSAFVSAFSDRTTGMHCKRPKFRSRGGTNTENLALQNIQARVRMVMAYISAQLSLWARGRSGSLLVLGSSNVDECLRGYLTKYDCSAADLNPIGGISKSDLKAFLVYMAAAKTDNEDDERLQIISLKKVIAAKPTAELEPIEEDYAQTDEVDMGMTYDELTWYGRLRKLGQCGPLSMFRKLLSVWQGVADVRDIATKVKFFFRMYAINRHKVTTLTPSYHAEDYSPEDNRFDLRQFLYNTKWKWQFDRIDEEVSNQIKKE